MQTAASSFRRDVLPREHGGWALVLEPLLLAWIAVPSWSALAVSILALACFFLRRPLRAGALGWILVLGAVALAPLAWIVLNSGLPLLWPLAAFAVFGGAFLLFERRGESRAAAAETLGSLAFACLPALAATLGGFGNRQACLLVLLAAARSVPTVILIRSVVRRAKGQKVGLAWPMLLIVFAFAAVSTACAEGLLGGTAIAAQALMMIRAAMLASSAFPTPRPRTLGWSEAVLGLLYAVMAGLSL